MVQHFPSHFAFGETLEILKELPLSSSAEIPAEPKIDNTSMMACSYTTYQHDNAWVMALKKFHNEHHKEWSKIQADKRNDLYRRNKNIYESGDTPSTYLATLKSKRKDGMVQIFNINSNFSSKPAFQRDGNLTDIPDNKLESIPAELLSEVHSRNDYKKVHIEGAHFVKQAIAAIVEEFAHIFSTTVQKTPARLDPFQLSIDETKWKLPANQLRCRRLDREREVELEKLIKILLEANIIEVCDAAYYSHAFLVPKPNGK